MVLSYSKSNQSIHLEPEQSSQWPCWAIRPRGVLLTLVAAAAVPEQPWPAYWPGLSIRCFPMQRSWLGQMSGSVSPSSSKRPSLDATAPAPQVPSLSIRARRGSMPEVRSAVAQEDEAMK